MLLEHQLFLEGNLRGEGLASKLLVFLNLEASKGHAFFHNLRICLEFFLQNLLPIQIILNRLA